MRLAVVEDPIHAAGLAEGNTFTIAASAKAFDILSSNLYQNKILAVIREISCNAADAHTMVGKSLADIHIHLPTFTEPYFSVRDYGPGLSHDNVLKLYTTYFMSTKDANNDLIGGFGLGSKSPFAVADQFVVTSWHAGICSEYVMYKDSGTPKVNLIRQTPTEEPSGLKVQVAIDKSYNTWLAEARTFFSWWPTLPQFNIPLDNLAKPFDQPGIQSSDTINGIPSWKYCEELATFSYALVGLVAYPINFRSIPNFDSNGLTLNNLILNFNIGEVDITPSRESLSYDPQTCANIVSKLENIRTTILAKLQEKVNKQPTYYDARELVYITNRTLVRNLFQRRAANLFWNGKQVIDTININKPTTLTVFGIERSWRSRVWRKSRSGSLDYIPVSNVASSYQNNKFVWVENPFPKSLKKVYHYLGEKAPGNIDQYYVVHGMPYSDVKNLFDDAGYPPVLDGSTFPEPPPSPPTQKTNKLNTKGYILNATTLEYAPTEGDLNIANGAGGIYIPFFDGRPKLPLKDLRLAIVAKLIPITEIIGIKTSALTVQKRVAELDKNKWVEYNETWFANHVDAAKLYELVCQSVAYSRVATITKNVATYSRHLHQLVDIYSKQTNGMLDQHKFLVRLAGLLVMNGGPLTFNSLPANLSQDQKDVIDKATKETTQLWAAFENFLKANPMLRHVDWTGNFSLDFDTFHSYITR